MTMDVIYEEHGSDWSHQVSALATTQWLQRDQTLPLFAKGVACETSRDGMPKSIQTSRDDKDVGIRFYI